MDKYTKVADVAVIGGQPITLTEFADGRVSADPFGSATITMDQFRAAQTSVGARFINLVQSANPDLERTAIDHSQGNNKVEVKETDNGLKITIRFGQGQKKLLVTAEWYSDDDSVVIQRDKSYDIQWDEYLAWARASAFFIQMVDVYKGTPA
jgi:hypothetical protein